MLVAYIDEFGHCGPYLGRTHQSYNQSPIFGLGGFALPHNQVRHFSTFFFQLKKQMLAAELKHISDHPATWEKKGARLLTTRNIERYPHVREGIRRLLNEIYKCRGRIFYYAREKYQEPAESNPYGLYSTCLSHTIRNVDRYACSIQGKFMMVLDQHSDRVKLLESASKTMFSTNNPARCLIEPPMQVESHLYQTVQAADWLATLIGRILAYEVAPTDYADWEWAPRYFLDSVKRLRSNSTLWRPRTVTTAEKPV